MLKEIVEYIVCKLVDNPNAVVVTEDVNGKVAVVRVRVAQEDLGKVIGKEGRVARSIRSLVYAVAAKQRMRASLEIEK